MYVPNFGRNWTKNWDFSSGKKLHFHSLIQRKSKNLLLNMRNLAWQNNGNFDGKCLCLFTSGIPEKSHGTKEVFVFPYFFINFKRRIFLQEGDDLPEIIKTKDQTNEFFRSFYQNYFQGNVFVWIFLYVVKFSCEDFMGDCNFLFGIKKHFNFFYVSLRYHNKSKWP